MLYKYKPVHPWYNRQSWTVCTSEWCWPLLGPLCSCLAPIQIQDILEALTVLGTIHVQGVQGKDKRQDGELLLFNTFIMLAPNIWVYRYTFTADPPDLANLYYITAGLHVANLYNITAGPQPILLIAYFQGYNSLSLFLNLKQDHSIL